MFIGIDCVGKKIFTSAWSLNYENNDIVNCQCTLYSSWHKLYPIEVQRQFVGRRDNFLLVFLNMGRSRHLFVYFRSFLIQITISIIQIEKSVDGVLGIRTRGRRMVGEDETTELWWHPSLPLVCSTFFGNWSFLNRNLKYIYFCSTFFLYLPIMESTNYINKIKCY